MQKNQTCKMTDEALENYGQEWDGVELVVTHVSQSTKDHPGYDMGVYPEKLYDLKRKDTDKELQFSLYDWELIPVR